MHPAVAAPQEVDERVAHKLLAPLTPEVPFEAVEGRTLNATELVEMRKSKERSARRERDPGDFHRRMLNSAIHAVSGPRLPLAIIYMTIMGLILVSIMAHGARKAMHQENAVKAFFTCTGTLALLVICGLLAAGFFSLWYLSGAMIKEAIEHFDVSFLGVDILMESLDVNVFTGKVKLNGISIHNPGGYATVWLLKADAIKIDLLPSSLIFSFGKHVVCNSVLVDGISVIYERSWTSSNLADVLGFLNTAKMGEFKVTIHKVDVADIRGKATSSLFTGVNVPLDVQDMHYDDFTSQVGKMGVAGVIKTLLTRILENVIAAANQVPNMYTP